MPDKHNGGRRSATRSGRPAGNPLRDPRDRRLNRIAGPASLVLFGVTGDLARKKLMPAVYDLANRGLLPPSFALVGFARRDWENEDFAAEVKTRSRPTPAPRSMKRCGSSSRRASGSCRASSTTTMPSSGCQRNHR